MFIIETNSWGNRGFFRSKLSCILKTFQFQFRSNLPYWLAFWFEIFASSTLNRFYPHSRYRQLRSECHILQVLQISRKPENKRTSIDKLVQNKLYTERVAKTKIFFRLPASSRTRLAVTTFFECTHFCHLENLLLLASPSCQCPRLMLYILDGAQPTHLHPPIPPPATIA